MSDMRLGIIFIFVVIEMLMIRVEENKGSLGYRSKGRWEGEEKLVYEENSNEIVNIEDIDEKNSNDDEGKYNDMKKSKMGENEER